MRTTADSFANIQTVNQLFEQAVRNAAAVTTAGANTSLVPADPLVLDLNGDGVKLTNFSDSKALFDIDNDGGTKEQTGWVSAQDGILVQDINDDGTINNISETLSEYYSGTVGANGDAGTRPYKDGFDALNSLDSNHDHVFNNQDALWTSLRVWIDDNGDGKSFKDEDGDGIKDANDASELKTLDELGITAINLSYQTQSGLTNGGNEVLASGDFTQNGTAKSAQAVRFLANHNGHTIAEDSNGAKIVTESSNDGADLVSYVSHSTAGETLDASALQVQNLYGGSGSDTLNGDAAANWLTGGQGSDTFHAGDGDDVLLIDADDTPSNIHAGGGNDVVQVIGSDGVALNLNQAEVEVAVGGIGNDVLTGGGRKSVFIRGGAGDDVVIGSAANDVLAGEDGYDLIDGGAGNDVVRGHRGEDLLSGGAGDDVIDGGLDDDRLAGDGGNDVLIGAQGDDYLDGGDGTDVAEFSGSYADYRITKIDDKTWRVVDTQTGRDGANTLTNIERVSFADVSRVDLTLPNPLPVKDILTANGNGQALSRNAPQLLSANQLLQNDRDWQGDALRITEVLEAKGGTATLTQAGDVLFTPDASFTGVMGFKYRVADAYWNGPANVINNSTGQTEVMKAAVYLQTPDLPSDPLAMQQWYLTDINVFPVWSDYTGRDIEIGQFEPGSPFSVGAEVFDYRHPDLQANANKTWLQDPNVPQTFSNHATMVAGTMVAANNGEGAIGIAHGASLAGQYIPGDGLQVSQLTQEITDALAKFKHYDVVNNSWGASTNFFINVVPAGTLETGIQQAVAEGRDGLGTVIVMAGGNERENGANTNTNALTANRAVITTGAINASGDLGTLQIGSKPFSNPGASILVSAPGSNVDSTAKELISDNGSVFGQSFQTAQGTSFAAPIVSAVIALMLEANPHLGYRDIQTILAMSAKKFDDPNGTDWVFNSAKTWNGGGMHASHDYGFGKVDALAAVRLAETWTEQSTLYNEQKRTASTGILNAGIPDGAGEYSGTLNVAAGLEVEHAQVTVELDHQHWGDLVIKLISPSGTESILVNRPGKHPGSSSTDLGDATSGTLNFSFNSTHHLGEASAGAWTIKVIDAATGATGTVKSWTLDLYGKTADSNELYVYTNEFGSLSDAARSTLNDTNGGLDVLNASAVTSGSSIDLRSGASSSIAGRALTINGDIEFGYGGDGNDVITGNAFSNGLHGGRGNDTLNGEANSDLLDGGQGNDQLTGGSEGDLFLIKKAAGTTDTITDFAPSVPSEKILLVGFDGMTDFSKLVMTADGANTRINLGDQSIVLLNVSPSQLTEQNFGFFSDEQMVDDYLAYQGNATYSGTVAADALALPTSYGNLRAFGVGGNDVIGARTQDDMLDGGDGDDVLYGEYVDPENGFSAIVPGNDWIEGGAGTDRLYGGGSNDKLFGGSGDDVLLGEDANDYLAGSTGNDYLSGGAGDDILLMEGDWGQVQGANYEFFGTRVGGPGTDIFKLTANGGGSANLFSSGTEFRGYNLIADFDPNQTGEIIDLTAMPWITGLSDLTIANWNVNGMQLARISAASGDKTLVLNLLGVSANTLSAAHFKFSPAAPGLFKGTASDNVLTGDAGANVLDGLGGVDAMSGRTGDDKYMVDHIGDTVTELPGGGHDSIESSVTYILSKDVEALTLVGSSNIDATGNAFRNQLRGNSSHNRLDGGAEADGMSGGAGDDTYVVDNQLDTITELSGGGTDTVESAVSWSLSKNTENVTLTGTKNLNATGNTQANVLLGNAGNNVLDGAEGADSMIGEAGDDTYYVDNVGDSVTEANDAGYDRVFTGVNFTLGANVESAVLIGAATTLTGNALDNDLMGNALNNTLSSGAGNDVLDGAAGTDTMSGAQGDDIYYVDNGGDIVTEAAGEGNDRVYTSVNLTMGADIENATLLGSATTITGNALDNVLIGNALRNTLLGGAGHDRLDGGEDADSMSGGWGNDIYVVDSPFEMITEAAGEGTDTVESFVSWTLSQNVENLLLVGTGDINGTGNALANVLAGNAGKNHLDGTGGTDTVAYSGIKSDFTVSGIGGSTVTIANKAVSSDVDTLSSVERVKFSDVSIAFDTQGPIGEVYRLYQAAFNREPDLAGFGYWINTRENGVGLQTVADSFVGSAEFADLYGANSSNSTFVTALYNNVLHRVPDQGGFDFWMNTLNSGSATRAQVLMSFSESTENHARIILDADGNSAQLYRLYEAAFDRAPDIPGMTYWLGNMNSGQSLDGVAYNFIQSDEFRTLYGANPSTAQFVANLYQNVLGRAPDQEGYDFWVGVLDSGSATRSQVLTSFSESNENRVQFVGVISDYVEYLPFG